MAGMTDDLEQYTQLLEHQRHMEHRALVLLGHFLAANAFALAAWATFYEPLGKSTNPAADFVMVGMAFFGYIWGLLWCGLGARNWGYARRMVAELERMANASPAVRQSLLYRALNGVERGTRIDRSGVEEARRMWTSHPSVLRLIPLSVSLLYVCLFALWMVKRELLWPLIAAGVGVVVVGVAFMRSRDQEEQAETIVEQVRARAPNAPPTAK